MTDDVVWQINVIPASEPESTSNAAKARWSNVQTPLSQPFHGGVFIMHLLFKVSHGQVGA